MSENLMNSAHKTSTPAYREGWDRIFGKTDMSDVSDTLIADIPCIELVNPNDYFWPNFWGHNYLVTLSEFGPTLMVNAVNEEDALDEAIDYAEEQGWEGLFLQAEDIEELLSEAKEDGYVDDGIYAYLDEYLCGGNHGRYLSSYNVTIKEVESERAAR